MNFSHLQTHEQIVQESMKDPEYAVVAAVPVCWHCGDETGDDDPDPTLCAMCAKAGRQPYRGRPMFRDFAAEMRAVIDAATGTGPYISRVAAAEIVGKLRADDPELLVGWLELQAEEMLWKSINDRDRSVRATARANASRDRFRSAADAAEHGDVEPMRRLLDMPFVTEGGQRKPLGKMTGADCGFVAGGYERSVRRARMHASLMRALERKIGSGLVEDHFTEETLRVMWQSLDVG